MFRSKLLRNDNEYSIVQTLNQANHSYHQCSVLRPLGVQENLEQRRFQFQS